MADVDEIVARFSDYRLGEIPALTSAHVRAWLQQFDEVFHENLIDFIDRIGRNSYLSEHRERKFINRLIVDRNITGDDPIEYWSSVGFIPHSDQGRSQRYWQGRLSDAVRDEFSIELGYRFNERNFIMVDDGIFSGDQARADFINWANNNNPKNATLTYVFGAIHTFGAYTFKKDTADARGEHGIKIKPFRSLEFENRLAKRNTSDVLWPDAGTFENYSERMNRIIRVDQFQPRTGSGVGECGMYRDKDHRVSIEMAMLSAGCEIIEACEQVRPSMKPLGYTRFRTPGFGGVYLTHRNCPNNAPLALWWGNGSGHGPLGWLPLFPRRTRDD